MSPAFTDSLAAPPHPASSSVSQNPNGQFFFSSFNCSDYNSVSISSSSDPNYYMDPNFGFNSPALGSTTKPGGLSSTSTTARIHRRKKPVTTHHLRSTQTGDDPGFNPFRPVPESGSGTGNSVSFDLGGDTFVFGDNKSGYSHRNSSNDSSLSSSKLDDYLEKNEVADEFRNLKIEKERNVRFGGNVKKMSGEIDERVECDLPDCMRQLNIENNGNFRGFGSELPDELKKLNIKENVHYKSQKFGSQGSSGISENVLPTKLKSLKIEESMSGLGNDKVNVDLGDKSGGKADGTLGLAGDGKSSCQMKSNLSSVTAKVSEMHARNLGGQKPADVSDSIPSRMSSSQVHLEDQSSTTSPSSFVQGGVRFDGFGSVSEASFREKTEKKVHFSFSSQWDDMGTQNAEFKTPNITGSLNRKMETRRDSAKASARSKKKKGKLKNPIPIRVSPTQDFVLGENLQEVDDSSEPYSPMDISPYQETLADSNFSRDTSVTSDEVFPIDDDYASSESRPAVSNVITDRYLVHAAERLDINEGKNWKEKVEERAAYPSDKAVNAEGPSEESISGAETESFKSATDHLECSTDSFVTATDTLATGSDTEVSSGSMIGKQESDGGSHFDFASRLEDMAQSSFIFCASSAAQAQSLTTSRANKKKGRPKVVHDSQCLSPNSTDSYTSSRLDYFPISGTSTLSSPRQGRKGDATALLNQTGYIPEPVKKQESKRENISSTSASMVAQESCEKWRLRCEFI